MHTDPLDGPVLVRGVHDRLVDDARGYARRAGIPPEYIWLPLEESCTAKEREWVRKFRLHRHHEVYGLAMVGKDLHPAVPVRMMGLTGALIRNFIDARMMLLDQALAGARDGEFPTCTALLIPDFFVDREVQSWRVAQILALLYDRMSGGLQTIVGVSDETGMTARYGALVAGHLSRHFIFSSE